MGLQQIVGNLVAVADKVTADLQDTVTLERWTGNNSYSEPTFAAGIPVQAIVEYKQEKVRDAAGDDILSNAKLTILRPIAAQGATGRREPIDPRDKVTLPDAEVGHPIETEGLGRPSTNAPYFFEVWITKGGN